MAKQTLFRAFGPAAVSLVALSVILMMDGCASAPRPPKQNGREEPMMTYPAPYLSGAALIPARKLWTRKVPGLLTDLNISRDGSTVLTATVPDHDSLDPSANGSEHYVTFYSSAGKVLSRTAMPAQVKSQTLSDDGSFAVIATYDDMIRGLSRDGKELWSTEASCRPIVLGGPGSPGAAAKRAGGVSGVPERILCFHDDDAEPDVGFEVFSWEGKRLTGFPIHDDALVLKVAPDERSFILVLTHGHAIVFSSRGSAAFKPVSRTRVAGEIVDAAISSFPASSRKKPAYALLYNVTAPTARSSDGAGPPSQKLAYFGARSFDIPVSEHAETIALAPRGGAVFGYSNTNSGQLLARFSRRSDEAWLRQDAKTAEYSSRVVATRGGVWVGFQDAHVLGFDDQGGLKTDIRAPGEEGAFLYGFAVTPSARFIAVGMDDGSLSLFQAN